MDEKHYLSPLFEPRSIAVIGATERANALGATLCANILASGYSGKLFAINPKYQSVAGIPCFPSIQETPEVPELVIIATPATGVADLVETCGQRGVKALAVLSSGFGESGEAGLEREHRLVEIARRYRMRLLGPNSLGLARPGWKLNATFAAGEIRTGSIALVSQSGALCAAVLDYARPNLVGFSTVISLGTSAELDFGEVLDYLVWDYRTEAILLYVEGIRDARRFLSALRAAARAKPVMVLKAGRHPLGSRAAWMHSGAHTIDDAVFDVAMRRAGVVRLRSLTQLFSCLKGLFVQCRPRGKRLAILTNGGGPGVLAVDRAGDLGIELAELSNASVEQLGSILPTHASHANPVDLIGDSNPERYAEALKILLADEGVDSILCLLAPLAMTQPTEVAHRVIALRQQSDKPIVTCWLGDDICIESRELFSAARIPSLRTPESAIEMIAFIATYYRNQSLLMQVPGPLAYEKAPMRELAASLVERALREGRQLLTPHEAFGLLAAFHVPTAPIRTVTTLEGALEASRHLGFPLGMRLPGKVVANIADATRLRQQWINLPEGASCILESRQESTSRRTLRLRVWRDAVFGPVIALSALDAFGEESTRPCIALPPLNVVLIRDMLQGTPIERLLWRHANVPAADMTALEHLLLHVSDMICELPYLHALDIHPLFADEYGVVASNAQIEVLSARVASDYAHMAIHPYPSRLVRQISLKDGTPVTLRPIKPEDAEMNQAFVRQLSPQTRYFRYMSALRELSPSLLARLTQIDYDQEMAFIATLTTNTTEQEIGVARFSTNPDGQSCEFAIVIADAYQKSGLGRQMMYTIIETARQRGLARMTGIFLTANERMMRFAQRLGFVLTPDPEDRTLRHGVLDLRQPLPELETDDLVHQET